MQPLNSRSTPSDLKPLETLIVADALRKRAVVRVTPQVLQNLYLGGLTMDFQSFMIVFIPFQLVMQWLDIIIKELERVSIIPDIESIVEFDPWQIQKWAEFTMWQLEMNLDFPDDDFSNLEDWEKQLVECKDSIELLRYDLEELYGEDALAAIEFADSCAIWETEVGLSG